MGGMVAWHIASRHRSVDAVIVSGGRRHLRTHAVQALEGALQPIEDHPLHGPGAEWRPGYFVKRLSTEPPANTHEWYASLLQDTVMRAELDAIGPDSEDPATTAGITVPVLFALGQRDMLWCGTTGECASDPVFTTEATHYLPGTAVECFIVPDTGHLTN